MPYTTKGKCVYKKKEDGSRGKKVGCTKGSVKKYLAALHANVSESKTKKDLLNEVAGVPTALKVWVNELTDIIILWTESYLESNGWDSESPNEIDGEKAYKFESLIPEDKINEVLIDKVSGGDVKEYLKSDFFKNFPMWKPKIRLLVVGAPKKFLEENNFDQDRDMGASINTPQLELGKIGKHELLKNVELSFTFTLYNDADKNGIPEDFLNGLKGVLKTIIMHELLHGYQSYQQLKSIGKPHFGKETALSSLTQNQLLKDVGGEMWKNFLNLVYLHLSFEINARVSQLYQEMVNKGVKTKKDFLRVLKKSSVWEEMKSLEEFDTEDFLNSFEHTIKKTNNPFIDLMNILFGKKKSSEETLKNAIRAWDGTLSVFVSVMKKRGIDVNMDAVPQKAKENPYYFFKFFEKRFHKKAEKFKRKLYKLASIVVTE